MAGVVVVTHGKSRTMQHLIFDWLSSAGGAADSVVDGMSGQVSRVVFIPDGGGTQPDPAYDVTLRDADGMDILNGLGIDLNNAASSHVALGVTNGVNGNWTAMAIDGILTLGVTGAGAANGELVILYFR